MSHSEQPRTATEILLATLYQNAKIFNDRCRRLSAELTAMKVRRRNAWLVYNTARHKAEEKSRAAKNR